MRRGRKMPSYETYREAYFKKQDQLAKRGYSMTDTIYSKADYEWMYKNTFQKQQQEVKQGLRKRTGSILNSMINDQAYELSKKQALILQKVGKEKGLKGSIQDYMLNKTALQDVMRDEYKQLRKEGMKTTDISLLFSQTYFGSE